MDFDFDGLCELAAEVLNVDPCATINKGWVLSGHQTDAQRSLRDEFHLTVFPGMQCCTEVTEVCRLASSGECCAGGGPALCSISTEQVWPMRDSASKMQELALTES